MTTETTTNEATETPPAAQAPVITPAPAGDHLTALKAELAAMRADLTKLTEAKPAVTVPSTETPKPVITPVATDTASLPVYARMAAGYSK